MSNPILEGMVRAFNSAPEYADVDGMRAALLWLASNVSDEMVKAFWDQFYSVRIDSPTNKAIAAALRQAAGGQG